MNIWKIFYWEDLRQVPGWEDVQKALNELFGTRYIGSNKDTELFDEFTPILPNGII